MADFLSKLLSSGGSPLITLGIAAIVFGFFLLVSGLSIIKIDKVTVTPGRKTWVTGLVVMLAGLILLIALPGKPELQEIAQAVTITPEQSLPPTATSTSIPAVAAIIPTSVPPSPAAGATIAPPTPTAASFVWTKIASSLPAKFERPEGVYDLRRNVIVVFSKIADTSENQTWEYDGGNWTRRLTSQTPPYRIYQALAYDPNRQVTVLFGGFQKDTGTVLNDTWEYDGTEWTQVHTPDLPTARDSVTMFYDTCNKRMVMFGGNDNATFALSDMWFYNGQGWTQQTQEGSPPLVLESSASFDPNYCQLVVFGGKPGYDNIGSSETWFLEGTTWTHAQNTSHPSPRFYQMQVYDPNLRQTLLFAGFGSQEGRHLNDTWTFDGSAWQSVDIPAPPAVRGQNVLVYDPVRKCVVLIADHFDDDLWALCPTVPPDLAPTLSPATPARFAWNRVSTSLPAAFEHPRGVYDAQRGVIVVFSKIAEKDESQTWEYDGSTWIPVTTSHIPPYRFNHTLVYDPDRRVVVLFGGTQQNGSVELGDTWEYDGSDWREVVTQNNPAKRDVHYMFYDRCRKQVMMFGGTDNVVYSVPDLWAYDGRDWTRQIQVGTPPPVWLAGIAFDEDRCRLVMFGGQPQDYTASPETWILTGNTWSRLEGASGPSPRWGHMMVYNPDLKLIELFGGYGSQYPEGKQLNDLWVHDGDNWLQETALPAPSHREQNLFVYNPSTKCSVLISDQYDMDLWTLCLVR